MKKSIITLLTLSTLIFYSCDEQNEDIVKAPDKNGSIETTLSVKHFKGFDLLTTTHTVWVKGKVDKQMVKSDTLKYLGTTKEEGEDSDGNVKDIVLDKDYEIYITVK